MRFKNRPHSQMPEVNLIPMMDVLMTVLTFFIIVTMTLTGQQLFNVSLPRGDGDNQDQQQPQKLTIGLTVQGQTLMDNQPIGQSVLIERVQTFLTQNPRGIVVIKADRGLVYQNVADLLKIMRDIGGDRVFLGVEHKS